MVLVLGGYYPRKGLKNRLFPSCPKPLFQSEASCKAIDMKMTIHSHAKNTRFESESFGTRK